MKVLLMNCKNQISDSYIDRLYISFVFFYHVVFMVCVSHVVNKEWKSGLQFCLILTMRNNDNIAFL